jgi:hypothetical protein
LLGLTRQLAPQLNQSSSDDDPIRPCPNSFGHRRCMNRHPERSEGSLQGSHFVVATV